MKHFFIHLISVLIITSISGCFDSSSKDSNTDTLKMMPLNDTGAVNFTQTFASNTTDPTVDNLLSPISDSTAPGQDADYGLDITQSNHLDGSYGFQFVKLDANGTPLADQTALYINTPWACVKDNVTGLIWEVKTTDGLRSRRHTYTWYEPDNSLNGGFAGARGSPTLCYADLLETCETTQNCPSGNLPYCDTHGYKQAVNALNNGTGLCGLNNWRVPIREELRSLVDYGATNAMAIDTNFFPNTMNDDTWTSQTSYYNFFDGTDAWEVHFDTGISQSHQKTIDKIYVRLVHSPL